jgi:hypothetical protein
MKITILVTMMAGGMLAVIATSAQSAPTPAAKQIKTSSESGDLITGKRMQQESLRRTAIDTLVPVKSYVHYTPRKRTRRGE